MEINIYILGFSLFIFFLGILTFVLISQEMKNASFKNFGESESEGGPRAKLFDAMYELFSDEDEWSEKIRNAKKSEIRKIVKEMKEEKGE